MATKVAIAIKRDYAVESLKESGRSIAETLGIEPPQLDIHFNDPAFRQAEELKALAAFNQRVITALQENPAQKKKVLNAKS